MQNSISLKHQFGNPQILCPSPTFFLSPLVIKATSLIPFSRLLGHLSFVTFYCCAEGNQLDLYSVLFPKFNYVQLISGVLYGSLYSLHERLLKVAKQFKIQTRWSPTDPQYRSLLVTYEAVRAKQTLDLILVSGRRRWFLLSLKKKYPGVNDHHAILFTCASFYRWPSPGETFVQEHHQREH